MTQAEMTQLAERLGGAEFVNSLELDPLTTLRHEGLDDLAVAVEAERDRIAELVDRIYTDDDFRQLLEQDPSGRLSEWGVPELAFEPLLLLVGAPDDVVERVTADVEAHMSFRKPATLAAAVAVLGTLAFAQEASATLNPAVTSSQLKPAATAQVKQAVMPQVGRAVTKPAFTRAISNSQVVRPALWKGLNVKQVSKIDLATLLGS